MSEKEFKHFFKDWTKEKIIDYFFWYKNYMEKIFKK